MTRVTTFIEDFKKAGCVSNDNAGQQEDHKFKANLYSETASKTKLNMRKCLASVLCGVCYVGPMVLKPPRAC